MITAGIHRILINGPLSLLRRMDRHQGTPASSQHLILTKGEGGERETLARIDETTGITIYYSLLFWTDQYNSKVIIRYPPRPKYCLGKSTHGKGLSQSIQYPPTVKYSRSKYCSTQARAEKHDPMIQHVAAAPPFDSRHLSFSHH